MYNVYTDWLSGLTDVVLVLFFSHVLNQEKQFKNIKKKNIIQLASKSIDFIYIFNN